MGGRSANAGSCTEMEKWQLILTWKPALNCGPVGHNDYVDHESLGTLNLNIVKISLVY